MANHPKQKILISACLLGRNVRYDGGNCLVHSPLLATWADQERLVPLCPEIAGGLPVPRPAAELAEGDANAVWAGQAQVITISNQNVTAYFLAGARAALALAKEHGIRLAILKEKSPSCGVRHTYDGTFQGVLNTGPGVTSALLMAHGIQVFNENQLSQAATFLADLESA